MSKIISVSRRTDIPAFYGDWFMNRLKDGFTGYINPFGGQKHIISLEPEEVACFVFWSKDYTPFIEKLATIKDLGYKFYFNYTITGLPGIFESNLIKYETAIENLKELCSLFSREHINWRYDPIIISDITDHDFHVKNFENIAGELDGYVKRCYFSFVHRYGKVKRNFDNFQYEKGVRISDPDINFKITLANELADIAHKHGIKMLSCCGDNLLNQKIEKAHCIDGNIIEKLFYKSGFTEKPTRKECGCTYSVDIGTYDTCPHGCIYCYANINKKIARTRFEDHNKNSAFLGCAEHESSEWVRKIERARRDKIKNIGSNSTLSDYL